MSKLQIIIMRKFQRRWSDLEVILMLILGTSSATYPELVEQSRASTSGVWDALQRAKNSDLIETHQNAGKTYYNLTDFGKSELAKLLN